MRGAVPLLLLALASTACSPDVAKPAATTAAAAASSSSTTTTQPTTTSVVSTTTSTVDPQPDCRLVADLEEAEELARWQLVNDGVMGGRSISQADVAESVLTVTGEIVTDGGGFSSVRLALDEPLGDFNTVRLRLRTDGRPYELTVADAARGRDRRVSHQGSIPAIGGSDWEEVDVDLSDLEASVFGRPVEVPPLDPSTSVEIGIILADGTDGPFRFELDWIRACT